MRQSIPAIAAFVLMLGVSCPFAANAQSGSASSSSSSSSGSRGGEYRGRGDLVDATRPEDLLRIARSYGSAKIGRTKKGKPKITGKLEGYKYGVYFYGCNSEHRRCKNIQFAAYFTGVSRMSEDRINDWNRKYRFGKAYLDREGDPFITMNVNLYGGVTRKNMDDTWDWWKTVIKQFAKFIQ